MVFREYLQQFHHGHQSPSVGTGPVELGMLLHLLHPPVHEQSFLVIEHPAGKLQHLFHRIVEIFLFTGISAHLCQGRNAHEEVIEPDGVGEWTVACQGTVFKPELLVADVIDGICD